ncbi:hypothetical protein MHB43_20165 [Paenibacillus sp. FSL H8-0317]|uniref:hypothetical protein n=1 Tax=Paenibacillus sp. FSL H8-0317 TaxID=2921385 RepID=UPI00324993BB
MKKGSIIPGFRTGVIWKKVIASIFYVVGALFLSILVFGTFIGDNQTKDSVISLLGALSLIVFFGLIPFILITNFLLIRRRLPLIKSKNWPLKIIGWTLSIIMLFICFGFSNFMLDKFYTEDYIVQRESEREKAKVEKEKQNKEVAAKREEEKKEKEIKDAESAQAKEKEQSHIKETSDKKTGEPGSSKPKTDKDSVVTVTAQSKNSDVNKNNEEKEATGSTVINKLGNYANDVKELFNNIDIFLSDKDRFSEAKVSKITNGERMFLKSENKYWNLFGDPYYKRTLEYENYIYYGETRDSKPHGEGVLYTYSYSNFLNKVMVPLYIGDFKDGMFNGYGTEFMLASEYYNDVFGYYGGLDEYGLVFPVYEGYFKNGKYHGEGILSLIDEKSSTDEPSNLLKYYKVNKLAIESFEKKFEKSEELYYFPDMPILKTSVRDIGEFKDGKLNGDGKQYNGQGVLMYEGELKKDRYHGEGKLYFNNGNIKYEGDFKSNQFHGKGTLYNSDGTIKYKGKFASGDIK